MFRWIVEKLIKTFDYECNVKTCMYYCIHDFVNNILIIFEINAFVDKNKNFNYVENSRVEKNDIEIIFLHVLLQIVQWNIDYEHVYIIFIAIKLFQNDDAFRKFMLNTNHQYSKIRILQYDFHQSLIKKSITKHQHISIVTFTQIVHQMHKKT